MLVYARPSRRASLVILSIGVAISTPGFSQRQPERFTPPTTITTTSAVSPASNASAIETPLDLRSLASQLRPAIALVIVTDKTGKETRTGTGFFVSSDGKLVTNAHVVEGADRAVAKLEDGAVYTVRGVIAAAADKDLVVLQVDAKQVPALTLSSGEPAEVGTAIAVIGSPLGLEGTLSSGLVSGNRTAQPGDEWLQITAPVSAGSSGSPVVNLQGQVIGVATFVISKAQAVNFARPVRYINDLLNGLGSVSEPAPLWSIATNPVNVVRRDPKFVEAVAAAKKNDAATALKHLNTISSQYADNELFQMQLGSVYYQLDLYEDSVEAYRTAAKLNPTDGAAWASIGLGLHKLRRRAEAIDAAKRAVKLSPDFAFAWGVLGLCYSSLNQPDRATDAFNRAARLNPKEADHWRSMNLSRASARVADTRHLPDQAAAPPAGDGNMLPPDAGEGSVFATTEAGVGGSDRQLYRVTRIKPSDVLHVRAGPGSTYPVIHKLRANEGGVIRRDRTSRNGSTLWQEIEAGGKVGWVNAAFIRPDP